MSISLLSLPSPAPATSYPRTHRATSPPSPPPTSSHCTAPLTQAHTTPPHSSHLPPPSSHTFFLTHFPPFSSLKLTHLSLILSLGQGQHCWLLSFFSHAALLHTPFLPLGSGWDWAPHLFHFSPSSLLTALHALLSLCSLCFLSYLCLFHALLLSSVPEKERGTGSSFLSRVSLL